jgi:uncharacterized Fe-S cluster-containing radical SAM superfamily enzyme
MLNFDDLSIPKKEVITEESLIRGRFIIGHDPFEISKEGKNVFVIYDKALMRNCMKLITSKSFDEAVEWFLKGQIDKKMYSTSKKFINESGNCKSTDQIKYESNSTEIRITV